MKVSENITLKEAQKGIIIPNPEERSITIIPAESGFNEEQVFTSDVFSNKIRGNFLGLVETMDGDSHPAYVLDEVTSKELWLYGKLGYENGPSILNNICEKLLGQEGILEVRSVRVSDRVKTTKIWYWMASRAINILPNGNKIYFLCSVGNGTNVDAGSLFQSDGFEEANGCSILPVVILDSIVINIDRKMELSWVGL